MKQTKLLKVYKFVRSRTGFSWKEFMKEMKCQYPSAETNYLSALVNAGYLERYRRGQYNRLGSPMLTLKLKDLQMEGGK